jgi:hypothetical protein
MLSHLLLWCFQCAMSVLQLAMPSAVCGSVDIGSIDSGLQCLLLTDYVTSCTMPYTLGCLCLALQSAMHRVRSRHSGTLWCADAVEQQVRRKLAALQQDYSSVFSFAW